jgi:hypothetical protein
MMDTMFSILSSPSTFFNGTTAAASSNCGATVVQRATKRSASLGMSFDMAFSGFDSAAVALSTSNKKKQTNSPNFAKT